MHFQVGVDFSPQQDRFASMEEYEAHTDESLAQQIDGFVKEQWGETYAERVDMVTRCATLSTPKTTTEWPQPLRGAVFLFSPSHF